MQRFDRLLTAAAALLLLAGFFLPLWRIDLLAPQYPEGLGMQIRINTIAGIKEHDLTNINALNHYIGMRPIEPQSIPELRFMPWVLGALVVMGAGVASAGRRRGLYAWIGALMLAGAAGLVDFYKWSYDYGHNLDWENAIIKVPGMAYQPPLLGSKQILNFTATSWPDVGGVAVLVAVALAFVAGYRTWRGARAEGRPARGGGAARGVAAAAVALLLAGCASTGPIHIAYDGSESCALCRMPVTDRRFGSQYVTSTGKALNFDSIECLSRYLAKRAAPAGEGTAWVPDFREPGTLVRAEAARFLTGASVGSPMGQGMIALGPDAAPADSALVAALGGTAAAWSYVLEGAR